MVGRKCHTRDGEAEFWRAALGVRDHAAVEVIGDRWSLLVLRDIILRNLRHFRVLQKKSEDGIASDIPADRLRRLVDLSERPQCVCRSGVGVHVMNMCGGCCAVIGAAGWLGWQAGQSGLASVEVCGRRLPRSATRSDGGLGPVDLAGKNLPIEGSTFTPAPSTLAVMRMVDFDDDLAEVTAVLQRSRSNADPNE